MRALPLAVVALLVAVALAGCGGGGRNEMRVIVSNPTRHDVDVWLRIESFRGDMKHNEPLAVPAGEVREVSMGDLQGLLRFTAIMYGHSHGEVEQMEPDEDWTIDLRGDGSSCFWFGVSGEGVGIPAADFRCG